MARTDPHRPEGDIAAFVDELQASGRYTFTGDAAARAYPASSGALAAALRRLKQRGRIVAPRRGFYVIVPTEYRAAGSPPPSWFIDDLMRFLGQPYYVGLLSAAALHGAGHQQPMTFDLVTDRPTREMQAGRARLRFHVNAAIAQVPVVELQTETGTMRVSSPASTAFDLVRFVDAVGGWSSAATVLVELSERVEPDDLQAVAWQRKTPEVQRLGYLLDRAGQQRLADTLLRVLASGRYRQVALAPSEPAGGIRAVDPWRVIPNVDIDLDL